MKFFLAALLSLAIRGTTGQLCEDAHVEVYDAVIAAFGEANCVTTSSISIEDGDGSDVIERFKITCSFNLPSFPSYSASVEYVWEGISAAGFATPIYMSVETSDYSTTSLETNFVDLCLVDYQTVFSEIASNRICPESHEEVLSAVYNAFGGEAYCESNTDGTLLTCSFTIFADDFMNPSEQKFSAMIEYSSDYNELEATFNPTLLAVGITGSLSKLGEVFQETYFTEYCLSEIQGILNYIATETGSRCRDSNQEVIDKLFAAYGEENCQAFVGDGRPSFEGYICEYQIDDSYTSLAEYRAVYHLDGYNLRYPDNLAVTQGNPPFSLETDFVDGPCIGDPAFESIFGGMPGNGICRDSSLDVTNDVITAYGEENCNGWLACSDDIFPQVCEGGWDCYLSVTGYTATTNYVYQQDPLTGVESPMSLLLNSTYADDFSVYKTFSQTYDFTFAGSCRSDFEPILMDEVLSNRMMRNCSNSVEEITYTRKKNGAQMTTTCAELARGSTKRMTNRCKLYPEIAESCRGICRTGEYCFCAENPEAFPVKQKRATSTCLELADLLETRPGKFINKCNKIKFDRNCPRTCGCRYQEEMTIVL